MARAGVIGVCVAAAVVMVIGLVSLTNTQFDSGLEAATAPGVQRGDYVPVACERMAQRLLPSYTGFKQIKARLDRQAVIDFVAQDPQGDLFRGQIMCAFIQNERFPPLRAVMLNDIPVTLDDSLRALWMLDVGDAYADAQDAEAFAGIAPAAGGPARTGSTSEATDEGAGPAE